jgi:hypothetical protein
MNMTMTHAPAAARTLNDWEVGRVLDWVRGPGNGRGDTLDHQTSEAISRMAQVDDPDRGRLITAVRCDPRSTCDTCAGGRWHLSKPAGADGYLYRLPEVVRAISAGAEVWSCEGEKDADALAGAGVVATSHHGGAGKFSVAQAYKLRDATAVVCVMDRDGPGAWDVIRRYDSLIAVGARRVRIVRPRGCDVNDAADHLSVGYGPDESIRCAVADVRELAERNRPARNGAGWGHYRGAS